VIQAQLILGSEVEAASIDAAEQAFNFTFEVQEVTSTNLYLQLNFENPKAISSSGTSSDRIQISFVNSGKYFKCLSSLPADSLGNRLLQSV